MRLLFPRPKTRPTPPWRLNLSGSRPKAGEHGVKHELHVEERDDVKQEPEVPEVKVEHVKCKQEHHNEPPQSYIDPYWQNESAHEPSWDGDADADEDEDAEQPERPQRKRPHSTSGCRRRRKKRAKAKHDPYLIIDDED